MKKIDYQNQYRPLLLADFNHGRVVEGTVDPKRVAQVVEGLNMRARGLPVVFRAKGIEKLEGGSCSSLSLRVVEQILPYLNEPNLMERTKEVVKAPDTEAQKRNNECDRLREGYRIQQAAFNAFSLTDRNGDHSVEKISAFVRYYGLEVEESTLQLTVDSSLSLKGPLGLMGPGLYLLRIVKGADNDRGEVHGHSAIVVKMGTSILYFDVNYGLYGGEAGKIAHLMGELLRANKERFDLDYFQFHRLAYSTATT
ncbi:MAG: hypothetical protein AB7F31_06845 [Parachlamydiales bacterium]